MSDTLLPHGYPLRTHSPPLDCDVPTPIRLRTLVGRPVAAPEPIKKRSKITCPYLRNDETSIIHTR